MLDQDKMNCMTLIAGKNASATRRVLVAHNEDDGGFVVVRHGWVPPQDWAAGSVMPAEEGCAEIPQVSHTLGYYWTEYRKDTCGLTTADGFVNERGVVIVSNSMGTSRESMENADCVKDGGIGYNLRRALAERAGSAREGARILMELIDGLSDESMGKNVESIYDRIATMSCKAAVKGNNELSFAEADKLIDELLKLENPYNCPHGRPTIVAISKYEMEKKFKRII